MLASQLTARSHRVRCRRAGGWVPENPPRRAARHAGPDRQRVGGVRWPRPTRRRPSRPPKELSHDAAATDGPRSVRSGDRLNFSRCRFLDVRRVSHVLLLVEIVQAFQRVVLILFSENLEFFHLHITHKIFSFLIVKYLFGLCLKYK